MKLRGQEQHRPCRSNGASLGRGKKKKRVKKIDYYSCHIGPWVGNDLCLFFCIVQTPGKQGAAQESFGDGSRASPKQSSPNSLQQRRTPQTPTRMQCTTQHPHLPPLKKCSGKGSQGHGDSYYMLVNQKKFNAKVFYESLPMQRSHKSTVKQKVL